MYCLHIEVRVLKEIMKYMKGRKGKGTGRNGI